MRRFPILRGKRRHRDVVCQVPLTNKWRSVLRPGQPRPSLGLKIKSQLLYLLGHQRHRGYLPPQLLWDLGALRGEGEPPPAPWVNTPSNFTLGSPIPLWSKVRPYCHLPRIVLPPQHPERGKTEILSGFLVGGQVSLSSQPPAPLHAEVGCGIRRLAGLFASLCTHRSIPLSGPCPFLSNKRLQ